MVTMFIFSVLDEKQIQNVMRAGADKNNLAPISGRSADYLGAIEVLLID